MSKINEVRDFIKNIFTDSATGKISDIEVIIDSLPTSYSREEIKQAFDLEVKQKQQEFTAKKAAEMFELNGSLISVSEQLASQLNISSEFTKINSSYTSGISDVMINPESNVNIFAIESYLNEKKHGILDAIQQEMWNIVDKYDELQDKYADYADLGKLSKNGDEVEFYANRIFSRDANAIDNVELAFKALHRFNEECRSLELGCKESFELAMQKKAEEQRKIEAAKAKAEEEQRKIDAAKAKAEEEDRKLIEKIKEASRIEEEQKRIAQEKAQAEEQKELEAALRASEELQKREEAKKELSEKLDKINVKIQELNFLEEAAANLGDESIKNEANELKDNIKKFTSISRRMLDENENINDLVDQAEEVLFGLELQEDNVKDYLRSKFVELDSKYSGLTEELASKLTEEATFKEHHDKLLSSIEKRESTIDSYLVKVDVNVENPENESDFVISTVYSNYKVLIRELMNFNNLSAEISSMKVYEDEFEGSGFEAVENYNVKAKKPAKVQEGGFEEIDTVYEDDFEESTFEKPAEEHNLSNTPSVERFKGSSKREINSSWLYFTKALLRESEEVYTGAEEERIEDALFRYIKDRPELASNDKERSFSDVINDMTSELEIAGFDIKEWNGIAEDYGNKGKNAEKIEDLVSLYVEECYEDNVYEVIDGYFEREDDIDQLAKIRAIQKAKFVNLQNSINNFFASEISFAFDGAVTHKEIKSFVERYVKKAAFKDFESYRNSILALRYLGEKLQKIVTLGDKLQNSLEKFIQKNGLSDEQSKMYEYLTKGQQWKTATKVLGTLDYSSYFLDDPLSIAKEIISRKVFGKVLLKFDEDKIFSEHEDLEIGELSEEEMLSNDHLFKLASKLERSKADNEYIEKKKGALYNFVFETLKAEFLDRLIESDNAYSLYDLLLEDGKLHRHGFGKKGEKFYAEIKKGVVSDVVESLEKEGKLEFSEEKSDWEANFKIASYLGVSLLEVMDPETKARLLKEELQQEEEREKLTKILVSSFNVKDQTIDISAFGLPVRVDIKNRKLVSIKYGDIGEEGISRILDRDVSYSEGAKGSLEFIKDLSGVFTYLCEDLPNIVDNFEMADISPQIHQFKLVLKKIVEQNQNIEYFENLLEEKQPMAVGYESVMSQEFGVDGDKMFEQFADRYRKSQKSKSEVIEEMNRISEKYPHSEIRNSAGQTLEEYFVNSLVREHNGDSASIDEAFENIVDLLKDSSATVEERISIVQKLNQMNPINGDIVNSKGKSLRERILSSEESEFAEYVDVDEELAKIDSTFNSVASSFKEMMDQDTTVERKKAFNDSVIKWLDSNVRNLNGQNAEEYLRDLYSIDEDVKIIDFLLHNGHYTSEDVALERTDSLFSSVASSFKEMIDQNATVERKESLNNNVIKWLDDVHNSNGQNIEEYLREVCDIDDNIEIMDFLLNNGVIPSSVISHDSLAKELEIVVSEEIEPKDDLPEMVELESDYDSDEDMPMLADYNSDDSDLDEGFFEALNMQNIAQQYAAEAQQCLEENEEDEFEEEDSWYYGGANKHDNNADFDYAQPFQNDLAGDSVDLINVVH